MTTQIQSIFSKGEINPTLHGRVDAEMYRAALRTACNVLCHSYGGVSNRAGLRYLGPVKDHAYAPRLIPFRFKTTDSYMLEFGDLYMRVIRENGHVTETDKAITNITNTEPPVVTSASHGYTNGDEVYISGVAGMTQVNGRRFLVAGITADTFELTDQVTGANLNGTTYTAYSSGGTVARIYTVVTPYAIADVPNIKFTQSADVMALVHQSYAPRELTRTAHDAWAFTVNSFGVGVDHPTGLTNPGLATNAFKYKVTAVDRLTEEESLPGVSTGTFTITNVTQADPAVVTSVAHELVSGDEIKINTGSMMTELWGRRFNVEKIDADTFKLRGEDSTGFAGFSPKEISVAAQTISPGWVWFKPDGLIMYIGAGTNIYQYTLSTAWDITTAAYASKTYSVTGGTGTVSGQKVTFIDASGTRMYSVRSAGSGAELTIALYTLSTAWDVSTASYTSQVSTYNQGSTTSEIWFNPTGTTMIVWADNPTAQAYQYTLSTAWDITTAVYDSKTFNPAEAAAINQFHFKDDGLKFFLASGGAIYQYKMLTPWDISTASYDSKSLSLASLAPDANFFISAAGDSVLTVEASTDAVQAFPLPTAWDVSSATWVKDMTFWKCFNSGSAASATLTWTNVAGADKYRVYHATGTTGVYGFVKEVNSSPANDLTSLTPDYTKGPPTERQPFLGTANYPAAVGSYEQRQVYGGSQDQPDTSFYSKIGAFSNFAPSLPTQADDPIQATLVSSSVNEIRHYVGGNDLLILTEGAEWKVNSGPDSGFSPNTIKQRVQSEWGSSHLRPQVLGDITMFVPAPRQGVRSLEYNFQTAGYSTSDLNTLAGHMFREWRMTGWASLKSPDPLVITVREDGDAPVMTLDPKAEVVAWARWDTLGDFESVGTARALATDPDDTIYFVVKRKINGETVRTVEYIANRLVLDVRDSFFVDCGLTYDVPLTITGTTAANPVVVTSTAHGLANGDFVDISDIEWTPTFDSYDTETQPAQLNNTRFKVKNVTADTFELTDESDVNIDGTAYTAYVSGGKVRKCVTTISGLWHLANTEVTVLADGVPVTGNSVNGTGDFTLTTRASRVHIGLKYTSDIETLNIESQQGTSQGKLKKISRVTARFHKSRGVYYGPDYTYMHELLQTDFGDIGATGGLFTGDIPVDFPPDWNSNGRMAFRQRHPLPMTLSAVIPDVETGR